MWSITINRLENIIKEFYRGNILKLDKHYANDKHGLQKNTSKGSKNELNAIKDNAITLQNYY